MNPLCDLSLRSGQQTSAIRSRLPHTTPSLFQPPPEHHHMQRMRTRPSLSRHPTTPVSSVGSRPEFNFLNSQDDLSDVEMTRRSIGMIISDTLSQVGVTPKGTHNKQCPVSTLELPEISGNVKRRALGTSLASGGAPKNGQSEKKVVTFAEGLPVIKGNSIPVVGVKSVDASFLSSSSQSNSDPSKENSTQEMERAEDDKLRPPWSAPLTTRSLNSITPRSRLYAPMALPKIDIVSEIYDELIVKTIQNYLVVEGYSQEKFHQLRQTVLARLSATYPHLVKHKAWRQGQWAEGELDTTDEEPQRAGTAEDLDALRRKLKSQSNRSGRSFADRGHTFDYNVRPFTCPFMVTQPDVEYSPPSFMAIDGRTMTITPRDDLRFRPGIVSIGPASTTPYRKLPMMNEEESGRLDEEDAEKLLPTAQESPTPFFIPGGEDETS